MIVYVPVPMSSVALETVSLPSAVSTAFADAGTCPESHMAEAMPHPMRVSSFRIDRG